MSDRNLPPPATRKTSNVIAASGRLRNEHFLMTADHILLEVDPENFELVSAMAEGNIQVHMASPDAEAEYVIFAQSAVYQPHFQRLNLNGLLGTRENGVEHATTAGCRELIVPTDGSFFLPMMPEQAEKRLPISHRAIAKAA
jgi:hypothetical protein